jgi:hypothetical protein
MSYSWQHDSAVFSPQVPKMIPIPENAATLPNFARTEFRDCFAQARSVTGTKFFSIRGLSLCSKK